MAKALRVQTTVLPGNRVEVAVPGLAVGARIEVILLEDEPPTARRRSILEFLDSLPPRQRSPQEWADIERQFQEERDAWDQ
jgi:hypothetical protein